MKSYKKQLFKKILKMFFNKFPVIKVLDMLCIFRLCLSSSFLPGCRKCKAALHPKISALKFKFYPINIGFAVDLTGHIRLIAIIPGPK